MTSSNSTWDTFNEICCCGSYTRPNYTNTMGVATLVFIFTNSILGKDTLSWCRFAFATEGVISSGECAAVSAMHVWWLQELVSVYIYFFRVEKKNQLDATEVYCTYNMLNMFRALLCPSSGARNYMCVITVYGVLVAGCRGSGAGSRLCVQEEGCCTTSRATSLFLLPYTWPPTSSNQTLHTIGGNNTHIASSSWWWA